MALSKRIVIKMITLYAKKANCSISVAFNYFINNAKTDKTRDYLLKVRNYYYSNKGG